ncbi:hypothetical protein HPDP_00316 [Candidatus Hepatincola sp. Pdp]
MKNSTKNLAINLLASSIPYLNILSPFIIKVRVLVEWIYGKIYKSAFNNSDKYVLTNLGQQFIHYAMTDLPIKIDYNNQNTNP